MRYKFNHTWISLIQMLTPACKVLRKSSDFSKSPKSSGLRVLPKSSLCKIRNYILKKKYLLSGNNNFRVEIKNDVIYLNVLLAVIEREFQFSHFLVNSSYSNTYIYEESFLCKIYSECQFEKSLLKRSGKMVPNCCVHSCGGFQMENLQLVA